MIEIWISKMPRISDCQSFGLLATYLSIMRTARFIQARLFPPVKHTAQTLRWSWKSKTVLPVQLRIITGIRRTVPAVETHLIELPGLIEQYYRLFKKLFNSLLDNVRVATSAYYPTRGLASDLHYDHAIEIVPPGIAVLWTVAGGH